MSSDPDPKAPPRRRLWLRLLLAVSLALNLLVLGVVIGAALRFSGPGGLRPPPASMGAVLFRELPRAERRALLAEFRDRQLGRGPRRADEAQAVAAVLRTTPYDAAALRALLDAQRQARLRWQTAVQNAWLARVAAMDAAQRAAFADRLEQALARPRHSRNRAPPWHARNGL